jgi:lipoic acid synthetase/lipoate-protein ligase A
MKKVILPELKERSLVFYLAMEEYLAGKVNDDMFFTWQTAPTVIIGRNQDLEAEVNLEFCRNRNIAVYRRKSGGGCVYSDEGNIMISYIVRRADVAEVFERYLSGLAEFLRSIGLRADKSDRNDVLVEGRKVSGNAFHQLPSRSIVHGTLLYSTDFEVLEQAIRPPVEKLVRHGVKSVRQRVRNLGDYKDVHQALSSASELRKCIEKYFTDGTITLTEQDVKEIEKIEKEYHKL